MDKMPYNFDIMTVERVLREFSAIMSLLKWQNCSMLKHEKEQSD